MRHPKKPRRVILCSRVGCEDVGITRILENGKQHVVCLGCWKLAKERELMGSREPLPMDQKTLSTGERPC